MSPRIALVSYSVKPRGGVVHTLSLAEALHRKGVDVRLVLLGDPEVPLFRPTPVPHTILRAPAPAGTTLDDRVFAAIDALEAGLTELVGQVDVVHTQDCIAARAAARVREAGAPVTVVRTVHHVDDFTTRTLRDCQRAAILEPDVVLVVSEQWRRILRSDPGREAAVVPNGVDPDRLPAPAPALRAALRARVPAGRFVLLGVGGVEPRKGTVHAFRALARVKRERGPVATLVVVGGHSFQDHAAYREAALGMLPDLGLVPGEDVVLAGTVGEEELAGWFHTADALCFPSVKEGWGLAVLEALAAGLPVVASDLPVFREYLTDGVDALLPPVGDHGAIADAVMRLLDEPRLRSDLASAGAAILPRFTWEASAARHLEIYDRLRVGSRV
ncbi:MSMEG_0565 family glycosyltransferase [Pseudonocardia kujensis]|uniref:MSMEG_0565 family glycosyltransferase n=1 Tax=Pseudonocardia kujensis TaxID=1128675 RepID=UPI001E3F974C|nr:MSMEG_0565 family glycosyltransferase [Pseudonocardia kujensis]MCE0764277.1 MSMEG_0565 family glycosyltransferase [Pseudonocardia kujensis]